MRYSLLLLFFVAVISILWVINDIPQDSIVESKHPLKKAKLKEVNALLNITQILLLDTTWFYLVMWNWTQYLVSKSKIRLWNVAYAIKQLVQIKNV